MDTMQTMTIKELRKAYKFSKVYLYKGKFIIVDPNAYYYRRIKGNKSVRLPESPKIFDWKGNLFVCNYDSEEKAESVAKSWSSLSNKEYFVGPVGPFAVKKTNVSIYPCDSLYPNGAGLYLKLNNEENQ